MLAIEIGNHAQCAPMALKLFRSTEFAQSRNFSPERQRSALHPAWAIVLISAWLALAGNWVLWSALAQMPELTSGAVWWIGLRVALLIASFSCALLGLFMWRWTLKPALITLIVATAWTSNRLGILDGLATWQLLIGLALLVGLPGVWLWRTALRRLAPWRNLVQVGVFVAASCAVFLLVLLFSFKDLAALSGKNAELRRLVSPYSAAGAVAALEKALLPRQQ